MTLTLSESLTFESCPSPKPQPTYLRNHDQDPTPHLHTLCPWFCATPPKILVRPGILDLPASLDWIIGHE